MIICRNLHKSYTMGPRQKYVLKGVNFHIDKGERIGLLGRNGTGKSTLLKVLGGVELPTSGEIIRKMSLSWPLALSGGFQGSLTGYDNARFIARIYDYDYSQIRDYIEDFAELGPYMKMPIRTYSAGMKARLAFALSLAIEFDCYLIDEVIAVGDHHFQKKSKYELFEKRHDRALILASHSPELIREYCTRALVLHEGYATMHDDIGEALEVYTYLKNK